MSAIKNQSPVSTCSSSPTDLSANPKRKKHLAKNHYKDSRIYIGSAFRSWRALRNVKGFRSDSDLAQHLLDKYVLCVKQSFTSCSFKAPCTAMYLSCLLCAHLPSWTIKRALTVLSVNVFPQCSLHIKCTYTQHGGQMVFTLETFPFHSSK